MLVSSNMHPSRSLEQREPSDLIWQHFVPICIQIRSPLGAFSGGREYPFASSQPVMAWHQNGDVKDFWFLKLEDYVVLYAASEFEAFCLVLNWDISRSNTLM